MCFVTHLDCQVCKVKDKYLFNPCESFVEEHANPQDDTPLPPRKHFHCTELAWPLPEGEDTSHHICDRCLGNGIRYYQRTVAIEQNIQFNNQHYNTLYPPVQEQPPTPTPLDAAEDEGEDTEEEEDRYYDSSSSSSCSSSEEEEEDTIVVRTKASATSPQKKQVPDGSGESRLFPRASEIEGQFPPNWEGLSQGFKNLIRDTNCRDSNDDLNSPLPAVDREKKFDEHWQPRLAEEPHRMLTLWIPFCTMCRRPSFNHKGGIDGVEFEPGVMLWKWLKQLHGEKMVVTQLTTGFIHKPCDTCIEKETRLRYNVFKFLSTASNPAAWSVWHWLLTRGTNWARFWNHDTLNVGLPDEPCYETKYFLQLMAVAWKARTGVAWEDTVDLDPPVSCPVATYLHQKPFLRLTHWNDLAGVFSRPDPVVQSPTLAAQAIELPYDEARLPVENRDEPGQDVARSVARSVSPTITIPDFPETAIGETRTLRQWKAKQEGRTILSSCAEKKRFFTARGAVIDENGKAVKALDRARALVSQQQEAHTKPATPELTPPSQPDTVNGGDAGYDAGVDAGVDRPSRKRQASGAIAGHENKRARLDEGKVERYLTPSTGPSRGRSPHTPGSSTTLNSSGDDTTQEDTQHNSLEGSMDDDDEDLFGDDEDLSGENEDLSSDNELEPSPTKKDAAAALVALKSGRAVEGDDELAPGNPAEDILSRCDHKYWHLKGVGPKDRWSFGFGVQDDEDDDGWD